MFYRLSTYAIAAALFPEGADNAQDVFKGEEGPRIAIHEPPQASNSNLFCGTVAQDHGRVRATAKSLCE